MRQATFVVLLLGTITATAYADQLRHAGSLCDTVGMQSNCNTFVVPATYVQKGPGGVANYASYSVQLMCPLVDAFSVDEGSVGIHVWDGHSSASVCAYLIGQDYTNWSWTTGPTSCSGDAFVGSIFLYPTRQALRDLRYDWFEALVTLPAQQDQVSHVYGYYN